jgi:hypothetical protein
MLQNTPNPALTADIELTPERCEYIGVDKIRVSLKTTTGEIVSYAVVSGVGAVGEHVCRAGQRLHRQDLPRSRVRYRFAASKPAGGGSFRTQTESTLWYGNENGRRIKVTNSAIISIALAEGVSCQPR